MRTIAALLFCLLFASAANAAPKSTAPMLIYSNPTPGPTYPITIPMPAFVNGHATVIASVNGSALAAGGALLTRVGSWNLEAGNFTAGKNPAGAAACTSTTSVRASKPRRSSRSLQAKTIRSR